MAEIFVKIRLRRGQLRSVSQRRLADAQCLRDSGQNERANGAMYMAGFVIECLLKAKLLEKYPWLQVAESPQHLNAKERAIWGYCYRSHDLDVILACLPEVYNRLMRAHLSPGERQRIKDSLNLICAQWTVFARYSPKSAHISDAEEFLRRVKEIKPWLM